MALIEVTFETRRTTTPPGQLHINASYNFVNEESPYIHIADPSHDIACQKHPHQVVIAMPKIVVCYDYPLRTPARMCFTADDPRGFTRAELARKICSGYAKIYREEVAHLKVKSIPPIPGMHNRQTTDGKYGIRNHYIEQLLLCAVTQDHGNIFTLGICS